MENSKRALIQTGLLTSLLESSQAGIINKHDYDALPDLSMPMRLLILALSFSLGCYLQAAEKNLYENHFEKTEVGKVPEDFLVLDGGFTVKEAEGKKFLELPGAPLETFAVQFGPARSNDVSVSASFKGTSKGRRFPVFGVGVCGVAGFKLQLSPAKQALEIYRDADLKASVPYQWASGKWISLQLQVRMNGPNAWLVEGKAWDKEKTSPNQPTISFESKESPLPGRCSVFGSPFSGEPIAFDDFVVSEPGQ